MGKDYLKTIHGLVAVLQIALGFAALFICSFVWRSGDVVFQFYTSEAPAQIYVLFALLITWIATISVTVLQVSGQDILEKLGKVKLLIYHILCLALIIIAAALDSYYTHNVATASWYFSRIVIVMIMSWVLVITYIIQIVFVALQ